MQVEKGFRLVVMVKFLKIEHCYNQWYFCGLSFGNQVAKNYQEMEKGKKKYSRNVQVLKTCRWKKLAWLKCVW